MVKLAWFAPVALLGLFASSAVALPKPKSVTVATIITDVENLGKDFTNFSFNNMPAIVQDLKQLSSDVSNLVGSLGHSNDKVGRSAHAAYTSATHLAAKIEKANVPVETYAVLDKAAFYKNKNALGVTEIVSDIQRLTKLLESFKPNAQDLSSLVDIIVKLTNDVSPLISIASMLGLNPIYPGAADYVEL